MKNDLRPSQSSVLLWVGHRATSIRNSGKLDNTGSWQAREPADHMFECGLYPTRLYSSTDVTSTETGEVMRDVLNKQTFANLDKHNYQGADAPSPGVVHFGPAEWLDSASKRKPSEVTRVVLDNVTKEYDLKKCIALVACKNVVEALFNTLGGSVLGKIRKNMKQNTGTPSFFGFEYGVECFSDLSVVKEAKYRFNFNKAPQRILSASVDKCEQIYIATP